MIFWKMCLYYFTVDKFIKNQTQFLSNSISTKCCSTKWMYLPKVSPRKVCLRNDHSMKCMPTKRILRKRFLRIDIEPVRDIGGTFGFGCLGYVDTDTDVRLQLLRCWRWRQPCPPVHHWQDPDLKQCCRPSHQLWQLCLQQQAPPLLYQMRHVLVKHNQSQKLNISETFLAPSTCWNNLLSTCKLDTV